jgi:hypothetical protein
MGVIVFLGEMFGGAGMASAADYYVSTVGSDTNTGLSEAQAWQTIQHAASSVIAGDIVHVLAGTYNEAVTISKSGTADQRIIFQGENYPTVDTTGTGFKINGDYVTITGFSIKNANYGIWVFQADHVNITHNIMDDFSCSGGILVYGEPASPYTPVYYPTVEHNIINSQCHAIEIAYGVWGGSVSYNTLNTSNNGCGTLYFGGAASDGSQDPPAYGWFYYMDFIGNIIRGGRNGFAGGVIYRCYIADNNISGYFHNGVNLHSTQYSIIENNWIGESAGGDTQHAFYIDGSTRPWHDNIFRNNHVEAASYGCGFNINNAVNGTVEDLVVDYCGGEGIIVIANLYKEGAITASGNWTFKNISFNTNAFSGVRFDGLGDVTLDGSYYFTDIKISGSNLLSGWTFDDPGTMPTVHVINTNDVTTRWISSATGGEFRFYYPLDIKVVDTSGNPISGATVTITNDVDSNYPSINYNFENKTSFTTGADGHTALPSDEENSATVMDFKKTSSGKEYMSYTITAEKDGYTDSTNVDPDSSWYRSNPNILVNTITIVLDTTVTPTVSTPTFSPSQGTYSSTQTAIISTATDGAIIYYTIDGADPTEDSSTYSSPITISSTTTLKAKAYKSGSNPSEIATAIYTITDPSDTTPPICSSGSPTGTLSSGTTSATLSLSTNETATCKYSTTAGTVYSSIANTFTSTNSTNHSTTITGLTDDNSYTYYIRCVDTSDNSNAEDYTISFSVVSTSGDNPGGGGGGTTPTPDTTSPSKVTNFTASAGDQEIVLTWKNPMDSDFVKTKILRKEDDYPANTEDGELIYDGNEETYTDTGLTNDIAYYYSAFTYDEVPNYSESVTASATPEEGKVPDPPSSDPDPEEEIYPEGTLLQTPDSFKIYVIINQKKKWIPTPEVFETLGYEWGNITEINTATLNTIPNYEDNLIRAINDYKVYLVVNGIKRHIPNPEIFLNYGFSWDDVVDVPQITIDQYTRAHLVRESRQEAIYYLRFDGVKKHIRNSEIFTSYNNSWDDVQVISKMEIDSYPESNLIQLQGDNRIYLIENNAKRHISSANVFNKYGYNWEHVVIVNKTEFDYYGMGEELK